MKLKRGLGLIHVFCIASGAMISSGLFILPGLAHARAGPGVVVSYLLAGLLAATGLLSIAELTTAMPKAGGDYFFITRGMGSAVGTVAGLLNWSSLSLKSAFALVGMAALVRLVVPIDAWVVGAALCVVFVAVNVLGVREAARLQVALVAALLGLMLLYVVKGLPAVDVQHFEPFAPEGARAIFSTAGFVFVSYGGLLKVASVAEEVRNPGRVIPLGLILSLLVVSVFYTLMVFVTSGVLPAEELNNSLTPISDGASVFMGQGGRIALGVGAALAFLTTANAGIMAASRYLLALSRDRLLPGPLGRVGERFRTPHVAILVTGAVVMAALFLNLDLLVKVASTALILSYILSNLSIIVLRESGLQNYQPRFRAPLYPWIQILGIVGFAFIILEMGEGAFLISALLIAAGFAIYWFYGRARTERESALLHLVQRLTAKELVTGSLEAELKEVIRERDDIVLDRFDRLIEHSTVLDLEQGMSMEEFFRLVAERLAGRLKVPAPVLLERLLARERESSTVLSPGLAIPHVIVEGEGMFEVLLARSRQGITFAKDAQPVRSVFVLVGTRDERNFHLRALSAIAQVVQEPGFEKKWMAARGEQALRDVVLLGERKRA
ncbi:MAG: amino acid permease [Phycisphaerae bacterium]